MLTPSSPGHQANLFGTDLLQQLDRNDPLLCLADAIPWHGLDRAFSRHCTQGHGRPAKPIRLMVGLLMLKQLENLSAKPWCCNSSGIPTTKPFAV